ncbi:McrC family protein [Aureispira anguillae]|uniref:McrC family protein n=1 Tax=Aureispira anguillae TaxID=2864201 RepID=A0A915YF71_9BACT|nr:McrC family protein [Aureispira anguillae]BDS12014.1 McrC family protein [Aureispira anguillae]
MHNRTYIQVFEHQVLRVDQQQLTQQQLDALAFFNEKHDQKYFTLLHKGVRFRQYVGVLQVGTLTIEILPKTDQYANTPQNWQKVLLDLLHACQFIKIDALSKAPLKLKTSPLLWLYLELYVQEIERLLFKGLQKNYRKEVANTNRWKGQINFAKQLQKNLTQPHRVYTTQQTYDYQHPVHQVLYKALKIVAQFGVNQQLKSKIQYLIKAFPPQENIVATEHLYQQLYSYPKFKDYHAALDLARMITLQYSPDLKTGSCPVLAILFDMNQLFEHYIYQQLKKHLDDSWTIRAQASKRFWASRNLRPDIWLSHQDQNYILDTKWKILKRPSPSDEDLRQIYAYNHSFQATNSLLIYPNVFALHQRSEAYAQPMLIQGQAKEHYCNVIFVNILNKKGTLNTDIAHDIIQVLNHQ